MNREDIKAYLKEIYNCLEPDLPEPLKSQSIEMSKNSISRLISEIGSLDDSLTDISENQWQWIVEMGWADKTTTLEDIALIASEIGEAVNECRGAAPTDNLKYELADIILRTLGTAKKANIDIVGAINEKMRRNKERGNKGRLK